MAASNVNQRLMTRSISHQIEIQRLAAGGIDAALARLAAADEEIFDAIRRRATSSGIVTLAGLEPLIRTINGINERAYFDVGQELYEQLNDLAEYEVEHTAAMVETVVPVSLKLKLPRRKFIRAIVDEEPMQGGLFAEWIAGMADGRFTRMRAAIRMGAHAGETAEQLIERLRGSRTNRFRGAPLDTSRRSAKAVIKTLYNHIAGKARKTVYDDNDDMIVGYVWVSALDDNTCFAAGTTVSTPSGERAIETLQVGDLVSTHLGPKRVIGITEREASVLTVEAGGVAMSVTPDHRFMTVDGGELLWRIAGDLKVGDLLCKAVPNENICSDGFYVSLTKPYDRPSKIDEVGLLESMPRFVTVPISAIDLNGDHFGFDGEIDRPFVDFPLLNERYAKAFKRKPDISFDAGLTHVAAIAGDVTEARLSGLTRGDPLLLPAFNASDDDCRSAAFFGAEGATGESGKFYSAPLAFEPSIFEAARAGGSAGGRANRVPASIAGRHGERDATNGARLNYPADLAAPDTTGGVVAGVTAKDAVNSGGAARANVELRHCRKVYCLRVEDARTFLVSGGILVHNCDWCWAEHGSFYEVGDPSIPEWPSHLNCQCDLSPVLMPWDRLPISDEITDEQKLMLNGARPEVPTFEQWITAQDPETQDDVLGKQRAAMFRRGVTAATKFIDGSGKRYSMAQLRRVEAKKNKPVTKAPSLGNIKKLRNFGWSPDLPDQRDLLFGVQNPQDIATPVRVSLRDRMPPVWDQGSLGSCTSHAILACAMFAFGPECPMLSRLDLYYKERLIEDSVNEDSGAMIRDGIKALAKYGVCTEATWPYKIRSFKGPPPRGAGDEDDKYRIKSYQRLKGREDFMKCLTMGHPFVFGFSVYDNFEAHDPVEHGVVQVPKMTGKLIGGHAVTCIGFDSDFHNNPDFLATGLPPSAIGSFVYEVRNSFGSEWGDEGYFWMEADYVENRDLSDDCWSIFG